MYSLWDLLIFGPFVYIVPEIEGEIVAFTPGRDVYMLTLVEVENGSYVHVCKPRGDIRGAWVKFDLVSEKLTKKDSDFSKFPSILQNPKMYIKAKSFAFPAYLHPYQDIQLCDVMLALQNDSVMRFVKSLCDILMYDYKISAERPWLKGNDEEFDDDLDGVYMEMAPEDQ